MSNDNTTATLETVNENFVFSKPIQYFDVSDTLIDCSDTLIDGSDLRVNAYDSVVDVSNSSFSIVDLSKNNLFIPIQNETIIFNEPSTETIIENKNNSNTALSKISDVVEDITEDLLNSVLDKVKKNLHDIGVKPSTLPKIIQFVMEAIEDTPTKGPAQKKFALKVIGSLIEEIHESDEKKLLQETFKSGGIEGTIELVVSASKGDLNINQVLDVAVNNCIFPVCKFSMSKFNSCSNKSQIKKSVKDIDVQVED